jgi:predicted nucleic acid-binding Zn ribbon protein
MACYGISNQIVTSCVVCGKPILAHFNKKTCSRECANKNRAGIKYKQIGAPLRSKVKAYIVLKKRLSRRRGIICERCGYNKFEILQVHHKDHNRENNGLDNLELICPNCHYEEHYLQRKIARENAYHQS